MTPNTLLSAGTSNSATPSLNRRQRSNTSPARSLTTLSAATAANASFSHQTYLTNKASYNPEQSSQPEVRVGEQEQPSTSANIQAKTALLSLGSVDKPLLKREANSPVYLDQNTISVASSNNNAKFLSHESNYHATRRVVQCNSSRIRSSDSDVTSISSQDENVHFHNQRPKETGGEIAGLKNKSKHQGQRNKWTKEETEALVRGCNNFAIGQWKAIRDSEPLLAKRSPGDLKDRFRTYFPDAYRQHYPNAKTHISSRVRSVDSTGNPIFGENAIRRERRQFSAEEDAALKRGYLKFGTAWSSIQRDPVLASRKATDLRDRFRNAFPDLYAAAGYKPRSRKASGSNVYEFLMDANHQRDSFDAIDLSGYSSHPSRFSSHLLPNQHQLPSLDFLKTHGAEAFSKLRVLSPALHTNTGDDTFSLNDSQSITTVMNSAISTHFANLTPRPDMNTPRPNDTTPRPGKSLATTRVQDSESHTAGLKQTSSSTTHETFKPPRSLHKTQSSMDLHQFTNLHQFECNFSPLTISFDNRMTTTYSSTFPDHVNYGDVSTISYPDDSFFQNPGPRSLGPTKAEGFDENINSVAISSTEQDTTTVAEMINTSIWVQELDNANQTFTRAFDFNGLANEDVLESYDEGSCTSSLVSSNASVEFTNERAVYAAEVDRLIQGNNSPTNQFNPFSNASQTFTSQLMPHESQSSMPITSASPQVQVRAGCFLEPDHNSTHVSSDLKIPMNMTMSLPPIPQSGQSNLYQEFLDDLMNHERLDQNNSCSSVNPTSDLNSPSSSSSPVYVSPMHLLSSNMKVSLPPSEDRPQ